MLVALMPQQPGSNRTEFLLPASRFVGIKGQCRENFQGERILQAVIADLKGQVMHQLFPAKSPLCCVMFATTPV